jgi:LysM repeat protein
MTKKAMDSYLSGSFKLGTDVSVAAGPVGAGVGAAGLADIYAFHRSKGVFGGLKIDGAVIAIRGEWNDSYYGKSVRPTDILIRRDVNNPHSADLRIALARAAHTVQRKPSPETKSRYHVVKSDDTLYRISRQYGLSVDELCRLNNMSKTDIIRPGQKLLVSY